MAQLNENRGFAGGVNLGFEHAEGHAVLLNSDTLTPTGWLDRLTAGLESGSDIGGKNPSTGKRERRKQRREKPHFTTSLPRFLKSLPSISHR